METGDLGWAWKWWSGMVVCNLIQVFVCARWVSKNPIQAADPDASYRRWMRNFGIIYVAVGAYRSVFVSKYGPQYAWFDSIANSSLLIRSFALFAEISFGGLFALALLRAQRDLDLPSEPAFSARWKKVFDLSPRFLWGALILAQVFATLGVITKSELAFAIEETLWGLAFLGITPLAVVLARRTRSPRYRGEEWTGLRRFGTVSLLWCGVYCTWAVLINLGSMVWPAAWVQMKTGVPPVRWDAAAIGDAFRIVNPTHEYGDWGPGFLFWHSSYFTVCVWLVLFLMRAPRRARAPEKRVYDSSEVPTPS